MKNNLNEIKKLIDKSNKRRDFINNTNREVISLSKQIILKVHKNKRIDKKEINRIKKLIGKIVKLDLKNNRIALQEFVETYAYYVYVKENRLLLLQEIKPIDHESYLKGIFDMTGELVRRAVNLAIKEKYKEVLEIYDFLEELYDDFSALDLRQDLRKHLDQLRWNIKRIEDIVFTIKHKK